MNTTPHPFSNRTGRSTTRVVLISAAVFLLFACFLGWLGFFIGMRGHSDERAVPPVPIPVPARPTAYEIIGFYAAAANGGTFVRTVEKAPVQEGAAVQVTGTGLYDGNWTVLQAFQYQGPRDARPFWGYRIEPKWRGFPPGFNIDGGVPAPNAARLQPLSAL